ncbi:MoaD/ThiS family protein [Myxococcota bacterium]|nr:MoaD/ThiS family protein [Myxococcota bacterium]
MPVTIRIPTPLRKHTAGRDNITVEAETVRAALDALDRLHPGVKDRLLDERGVRRFINVYYREEDIRFLQNLDTPVTEGGELVVVPALAGG